MKLVIFSSAPIVKLNEGAYMYAPYEKEMQLWAKYAQNIQFCCPIWKEDRKLLISRISFPFLPVIEVKEFDVTSLRNAIFAVPIVFRNLHIVYKTMQQADHIHLRCPGNMGLIGAIVQILFPKKRKTAKYAGNWDPQSKQPWSYRLQKSILSSTFLTKNMQVLVYGEWPNQTKNIKSFFTATYAEHDKKKIAVRELEGCIQFLFVGTLVPGKQPLFAIQLIEQLHQLGYKVHLDVYGEGVLRKELENYIADKHLAKLVHLKGNQTKESIEKAYQDSHFLVLPSKSEGWPKVAAEAMFWGCVPVVTPVSCVSYMLGQGTRGLLLTEDLRKDTDSIKALIVNQERYSEMSKLGRNWSRKYTMDKFEKEIQNLIV